MNSTSKVRGQFSDPPMRYKISSMRSFYLNPLSLIAKASILLVFMAIIIRFASPKVSNEKTKQTGVIDANPTVIPASLLPLAQVIYPSQVLNLTNWKITLPTGFSGNPTEIKQPELTTYNINPWFIVVPEGNAVRFRAAVNGTTTSGSDYPRSELREMVGNGNTKASWSSREGVHIMFLDQAITTVPKVKPGIVAGQVHDSDKDIIVIRLDYPNLHIRVDKKNVYTLDPDYKLGKRFKVKFVVSDSRTNVYYNNSTAPVYTLNKKYSDAYFKIGAYTQSNCSKEDSPSLCNGDNYGEVVVYQVTVTHQ